MAVEAATNVPNQFCQRLALAIALEKPLAPKALGVNVQRPVVIDHVVRTYQRHAVVNRVCIRVRVEQISAIRGEVQLVVEHVERFKTRVERPLPNVTDQLRSLPRIVDVPQLPTPRVVFCREVQSPTRDIQIGHIRSYPTEHRRPGVGLCTVRIPKFMPKTAVNGEVQVPFKLSQIARKAVIGSGPDISNQSRAGLGSVRHKQLHANLRSSCGKECLRANLSEVARV